MHQCTERWSNATDPSSCLSYLLVYDGAEEHRGYEKIAASLATELDEDDSVLVGDIGIIAYRTGAQVIDLAGLVTPETIADERGAVPSLESVLATFRPEAVVLREPPTHGGYMIDGGVLRQTFTTSDGADRFVAEYEPLAVPRGAGRLVWLARHLE